jgi:hypothetical protein
VNVKLGMHRRPSKDAGGAGACPSQSINTLRSNAERLGACTRWAVSSEVHLTTIIGAGRVMSPASDRTTRLILCDSLQEEVRLAFPQPWGRLVARELRSHPVRPPLLPVQCLYAVPGQELLTAR